MTLDELVLAAREISLDDHKTLTQLSLKVAEECGELAEAVLSYTEAPGNKYKGLAVEHVAEEAVDTMIVAWAVLFKIGVSDSAIATLVRRKLTKWDNNNHNRATPE
jgi:NTP pyrophosphatase (non-canonical NTP hydrolase)